MVWFSGSANSTVSFTFTPDRSPLPRQRNFGQNGRQLGPLKRKLHVVCTYPLFSGPRYPIMSFKLSPVNPRCHGNEFWDKIGYNLAPVEDNCALFAPTPIFSEPGYLMLSFKFLSYRLLLPWQRI